MNAEWIARMVAKGESESLEIKTTTGARREAARTVCAMLNQQGGHVLFGVTPEGRIDGQQVSERTLEQLSAELANIDPRAFPNVGRVDVGEHRQVLVISVKRGPTRPYQYRGTAYLRVGNTTRAMGRDEYSRMLLEHMHGEQRWENQAADGWSIEDLDVAEIRNTVAEAVRIGRLNEPGHRDPESLLLGLGLIRDGVLLRAAAVLFGDASRLEFEMPQCLLRVARFRGVDRSEFLDNRQFNGNAFALLSNAERFLRETLPISSRFESGRIQRIDEPLYPPLATREALANALCHRDYSISGGSVGLAVYDDRLEVTSTGGLHFGLTPDDLFDQHESRPWNPLIARTFFRRGVIEEWGRGTLKMTELVVSAGLPRPEIDDIGDCVTVRFPRDRVRVATASAAMSGTTDRVKARRLEILSVLGQANDALTLRDIHALLQTQTGIRLLREDMASLKALGLVEPLGYGRGARWKLSK